MAQQVKNPPETQEMQEMWIWCLEGEDPLEEGMATYSSILSREIPWAEESGRLWSMGLQRVGTQLKWLSTQSNTKAKTVRLVKKKQDLLYTVYSDKLFLKKTEINCKEKMKKIYTTQSLSIECMLGKIGDWNSTQWTNFQQWKWKITMCNNLDVPHKKYWVKRQPHDKMMSVFSMVIFCREKGGNRTGWGHKESFEMLDKIHISWSGCCSYLYGCLLCDKSRNWHLFVYSSLCIFQ